MPGAEGRQSIEVFRLESGKMTERQATGDALGVPRQLGIMPVSGPTLVARPLASQVRKRHISGRTLQELDLTDGAVASLARDRILFTVTQVRPVSAQWAYTIQPWVWTSLTARPELLANYAPILSNAQLVISLRTRPALRTGGDTRHTEGYDLSCQLSRYSVCRLHPAAGRLASTVRHAAHDWVDPHTAAAHRAATASARLGQLVRHATARLT
jgi:hypothetical protein